MSLLTALTFLFLFYLQAIATYTSRCLSRSQANCLIDDWLRIRSTNPTTSSFTSLLEQSVASEATFEDETISFYIPPGGVGQVGPFAKSRAEYLQSRIAGESISTTTTPVFTLQAELRGHGRKFGCDFLALRWISTSEVKVQVNFSTAAVGDPVVYKGIDLAIVDVKTSKITNVYTSADYIREITQKGFPLG